MGIAEAVLYRLAFAMADRLKEAGPRRGSGRHHLNPAARSELETIAAEVIRRPGGRGEAVASARGVTPSPQPSPARPAARLTFPRLDDPPGGEDRHGEQGQGGATRGRDGLVRPADSDLRTG